LISIIPINNFWADSFVGATSFILMQAAVTGKFRSGGRGRGQVRAMFQLILAADQSGDSRMVLICQDFEGCL
jgi:hypothetical protein